MTYRVIFASLILTLASSLPADAARKNVKATAADHAQLKKLLRPHRYYGGGIPYGVRAAAGDVNMPVVDRRVPGQMSAQCSFKTARGKKTLICQ
ncbi:MAG: hypothetical protein ACR2O8_14790 [Rhizobiaceae bacterium]